MVKFRLDEYESVDVRIKYGKTELENIELVIKNESIDDHLKLQRYYNFR